MTQLLALLPSIAQEADEFDVVSDFAERECNGDLLGSFRQGMLYVYLQEISEAGKVYRFTIETPGSTLTDEDVNSLISVLQSSLQHMNLRLYYAYGGPEHGPHHMAFLYTAS